MGGARLKPETTAAVDDQADVEEATTAATTRLAVGPGSIMILWCVGAGRWMQ